MVVLVFSKINVWDANSRSWVESWDMDNPEQLDGKVVEKSPLNVQDLFTYNDYKYTKLLKIAVDRQVSLACRVKVPEFSADIWNIDNVQPRIRWDDTIAGYNLICRTAP